MRSETPVQCSGWASGVLGAVDRWLFGLASRSSAQAVIAQTLCEARFPSGRCRSSPMLVGDVVVGPVVCCMPSLAVWSG